MGRAQVHYEVFIRKVVGGSWTLDMATEDRAVALATAGELVGEGRCVAARVTKETLDPETREFASVTIQTFGAADVDRPKKVRDDSEPLCVAPQDLYSGHARERIGRLLEGWLVRKKATPFELLHRADLVEQLEASGVELQHAIQKIAIPEAQARGKSVHEVIRFFQSLAERSIERLAKDARGGAFPDIDREGYGPAAERISREAERGYLLGGGVARSLAPSRSWTEKVTRLLDLADAAPLAGPPRALALATVEQPLAEILSCGAGLDDLLGKDLDLGARLAAMTRLAANEAVEALIRMEPAVARLMPPLSDSAQRLAHWLATEDFGAVRAAISRRVLRELKGPRRLKPSDPAGEIQLLRALGMALAASTGSLLPPEDVQETFVARSKMLVMGDFVEGYLATAPDAFSEAEALVWLADNVVGGTSKRQAGRWLAATVSSLRFETEALEGSARPAQKLAALAALQRGVARLGLAEGDADPLLGRIGDLGGQLEAQAKVTTQIARARAPAFHRLALLLKLAVGEAAPLGPAADRARAEALKLVRSDDARTELARSPEQMAEVRDLIQRAGLAA